MSFETPAWVRDAVFYQIFPDRFAASARVPKPGPLEDWDAPPTVGGFKGGDLLGVAEHLDHLEALGITAIYFNPIFQSASNHRYHTYDYLKVDPLLGGDEALRELLDACHARGMKVVLDGVFNHASRGFWPFNHVMEVGWSSPYRDWFYFHEDDLRAGRPLRAFPHDAVITVADAAGVSDEARAGRGSLSALGYQAWWDLPALPKLNVDNPHVRDYLLGVAEHWLRFGIDGWRLDVAEEVPDWFWREFRQRVKAVDPEAYIVAEIWHVEPRVLQGDMYDALMNYPLGAAITSFVGAGRLDRRVLAQHFTLDASISETDGAGFAQRVEELLRVYPAPATAVQLNLLDSHDTPRFLAMVSEDKGALRLATLLQMAMPGAPSVYYGDEIGLTGEQDPYSRGSFPWQHPDRWDRGLLEDTRASIALRHANPALRHGDLRTVGADGRAVAFRRSSDGQDVIVAVNAGEAPTGLRIHLPDLDGRPLEALRWSAAAPTIAGVRVEDGGATLDLPARDAVVLRTGS